MTVQPILGPIADYALSGMTSVSTIALNSLVAPDYSDLTSMFVGRDGSGGNPIPGDPTSGVVGLVLNKAGMGNQTAEAYIADQLELITNGTFDNDTTGWAQNGTTISQEDGKLKLTGSGTGADRAVQEASTVVGDWYVFVTDCIDGTDVGNTFRIGATNNITGTGAYTEASNLADGRRQIIFQATAATTYVVLRKDSMGSGETSFFDNVSLKHIPGQHLVAPADNQRPVLDRRPVSGRRNLIDTSNPFNWFDVSRVTLAEDGTVTPNGETAYLVGKDPTGGTFRFTVEDFTAASTGNYTYSVLVKPVIGDKFTMLMSGDNGVTVHGRVVFDTTLMTATDYGSTNLISSSITDDNGWCRLTITADLTTNTVPRIYIYPHLYSSGDNGSFYFGELQVEQGTSRTPYQKVTNDNDITEAGVPSVYSPDYDGVDDGLTMDFAGGAGPSDCSVFFAVKTTDTAGTLFFSDSGKYLGYFDGTSAGFNVPVSSGASSYIDGSIIGVTELDLQQAITDGNWHIGEFRGADISSWDDIKVPHPSVIVDGKIIGPIIVETSKLTNSLRRTIEQDLKRKAGIQ